MSRNHIDRFMRRIISTSPVTKATFRETLECGHVVLRRQDGSHRRRCLECAGEHYSTRLPFRESWAQRVLRKAQTVGLRVRAMIRRAAV